MTSMEVKRQSVKFAKLPKPVFLNMFSIADDEWRNERWSKEEQITGLAKLDPVIFLPLFWRAIDDEGKRMIVKLPIFRWEGDKEIAVTPESPEERLKYIISGQNELIAAFAALMTTLKNSVPSEAMNEEKKSSEVEGSVTPKSST